MKKIKEVAKIAVAYLILPLSALAAEPTAPTGIGSGLYVTVKTVVNTAITIIFILMTLYFIFGVFQLVSAGGDEKKVAAGKQHMIWGILGIVVAAGIWGIVYLVTNFLGISGGSLPTIPQF